MYVHVLLSVCTCARVCVGVEASIVRPSPPPGPPAPIPYTGPAPPPRHLQSVIMKSLSLVLVVSILYGVVSPSLQCPVALVMTGCVCTPIMTRFLVRCNGISIDLTISAIRNQTEIMDFISRVEIM